MYYYSVHQVTATRLVSFSIILTRKQHEVARLIWVLDSSTVWWRHRNNISR